MSMRIQLVMVTLLLAAACSREATAPRFPDGYYGTWECTGTSGGMDGKGYEVEKGTRLVLTPEGEARWSAPGKPARTERFRVGRGPAIFSSEPIWKLLTDEEAADGRVISLSPDGTTLTISDNHPDGFNLHYRRAE